jgi:hypothetical protein
VAAKVARPVVAALELRMKTNSSRLAFFYNRDFRADSLYLHAEITVGARSAQWLLRQNRLM